MNSDCKAMENEAHDLFCREKYEEAYDLFNRAAEIHTRHGNHKEAALCFASAAGSWGIKSGEKTFYKAARAYENAAHEAEASGDLEYASILFKHATISYEKDMESQNYSDCFYRSKEAYRKFLWFLLTSPKKVTPIVTSFESRGLKSFFRHFFWWLSLTVSTLVWGHGERPMRTFFAALSVVFGSAYLYTFCHLVERGVNFRPDFLTSLYYSFITYATVGYGDITPVGLARLGAMLESVSGLFLTSLLIIGLSRKYLRV